MQSYQRTQEFELQPGQTVEFAGHTFTYEGFREVERAQRVDVVAGVRIDGEQVYAPSLRFYRQMGGAIGTPSVNTGLARDVYLTLESPRPTADDPTARIKVLIMPLAVWLWIGGGLMAVGTVLAAFPGRRRNPLDPVSAPAAGDRAGAGARVTSGETVGGSSPEPVGVRHG
jgi:cytochrome c-type biogenesis protein CcmF